MCLLFVVSIDQIVSEHDEFAKIWAIIIHTAILSNDGYCFIDPEHNVPWLDNVNQLYVRPCYISLKHKIIHNELRSVLLLGTPGIGKSLFLRWLLVTLAREKLETAPEPHLSFRVRFADKDYYCSTESVLVKHFNANLPRPDYYFSDSHDILEYHLSSKLTILVSSDDQEHHKTWKKKVEADTRLVNGQIVGCGDVLNMPIFDWTEIQKITPNMDDNVRQFRFDVVNGIARRFLSSGTFTGDPTIEEIIGNELDEFFADSPFAKSTNWQIQRTWAINTIGSPLLLCIDPKQSNLVFNSLFKCIIVNGNTFKSLGKSWTSLFLKHLAAKITNDQAIDQLSQIRAIFQNCGSGYLFEYTAHRKLSKSNHDYLVFDMGEKKVKSLKMRVSRVVLIRTIDDIAKLKTNEYGLPTISNFPLVDAIYNNILINYTIAEHHSGAVNQLSDIKDKINAENYYLLFVVPIDIISKFKMININTKGIKPYKTHFANVYQCLTTDDKPASEDIFNSINPKRKNEDRSNQKNIKVSNKV